MAQTYDIVPWFSKKEFEDVYRGIFSNDIQDNVQAYRQLCVWKSRACKLPIGIECTIPLVQAQIALLDNTLEVSCLSSLLDYSLMKFVSLATTAIESSQKNVVRGQRHAADLMNLPSYIIDLRNNIAHTDKGRFFSMTMKSTLAIALQWVKIHYWQDEMEWLNKAAVQNEHSVKNVASKKSKEGKNKKALKTKGKIKHPRPVKINPVMLNFFKNSLNKYFLFVLKNVNGNQKLKITKKRKPSEIVKQIRMLMKKNPGSCAGTIVREAFFGRAAQSIPFHELSNEQRRCCSCWMPEFFVKNFQFIVSLLAELDVMEVFFDALLTAAKKAPIIGQEWIKIFANSFLLGSGNIFECEIHAFDGIPYSVPAYRGFSWQKFLCNLFNIGQAWSSEIGLKLCQYKFVNISKSQKSKLFALDGIYNAKFNTLTRLKHNQNNNKLNKDKNKGSSFFKCKRIYSVRSLKKLTERAVAAPKEVPDIADEDMEECLDNKNEIEESLPMIGILSHQKFTQDFYQQLIITPAEPERQAGDPGHFGRSLESGLVAPERGPSIGLMRPQRQTPR